MLVAVAAGGYFLIIRPGKKRQQQQQELVASLRPGAEIMTTAGIFGTIAVVTDEQISLEVSPGVYIRLLPQAVARVIEHADEPVDEADDALSVDEGVRKPVDPEPPVD